MPEGFTFGLAEERHIPSLTAMSRDLFTHSRYVFDEHFDTEKVNSFYSGWVEKSVRGQLDDECWCLFDLHRPVAFCTLRYGKEKAANIGVLGLDDLYQGRGLGKRLLQCLFNQLLELDVKTLTVVTQGRNIPAQNLYQSVGFRTKATQLWYHKWC
ncbi:MAG: GNAT family N-acetyltransferase [Desulfovibrionaceae bacterium]